LKSVCALAVLAASSGAGLADEQLVMPFTCQVERGRVVLTPAPNQSYPILGKRQQRKLTTCSPYGDGCQRRTVHRFDLDCGGTRTDWRSVAAAMGAEALSPGPGYSAPPPLPRYGGPQARFYFGSPYGPRIAFGPYGPSRAYPVPPQAYRPMGAPPPGFAPMPGRLAYVTAVPVPAATGPIAEWQSVPLPTRKPQVPAAAELASSETQPGLIPPAASSGVHAVSPMAPPSEATIDVAKQTASGPPAAAKQNALGGEEITGAIPAQAKAARQSSSINLIGAAGLSFAALLLFASFVVLSRRRSRSLQLAEDFSREPVAHDMKYEPGYPEPLGASAYHAREHSPTPAAPRQSEWLPTTLSEALDVLGASSETGADILKTLVKNLRRTWHPDLAAHEADRRVRERKLKQVNVAWDIVTGKRRVRRPPVAAGAG
jgi:hypothetical protein